MMEQAKKNKGKMLFVTVNTDEEDYKMILEYFGIVDSELPTFRAMRGEAKGAWLRKPKDDRFTAENVKKLVTDFQEGMDRRKSKEIIAMILSDIIDDIIGEDSEVNSWMRNTLINKLYLGQRFICQFVGQHGRFRRHAAISEQHHGGRGRC